MRVLVVSSTVYNEIASEPTVLIVPIFDSEPDAGFGVDVATAGRHRPDQQLPQIRLEALIRHADVQTLTEVNTMLFRILATPER